MLSRLAVSGGAAWGLIGAGLSLLALSALLGWQLLQTRESLGECKGDRTSHIETATINAEAVVAIRDRLALCLEEQAADLEAIRQADAAREQRINQLQRQVEAARAERGRIYETDEDCRAWGAGPVCAAIADSLRNRTGSED